MSIPTLAHLALAQIPTHQIPHMSLKEKTSIHYEIYPLVKFPNFFKTRSGRSKQHSLSGLCSCPNFGRCLCYLFLIRDYMVDVYWGDLASYSTLSGWFPAL